VEPPTGFESIALTVLSLAAILATLIVLIRAYRNRR
jgi:hypothetical protein